MYGQDVQTVAVRAFLELLDELCTREPGGAMAFDGDGTLWSGDVGDDTFHALLDAHGVTAEAHEALALEATAVSIDASGGPTDLARRIHDHYRAGAFPEERMCEVMAWVFSGWSVDAADAFAEQVLVNAALHARLHPEAMQVLGWAAERGVACYLVSASPRTVVERAARRVGIALENVVSVTEQRNADGFILPSVMRPIPYGTGKVTRLREKLGPRPLYAAFGDNAFDVPMLREATLPVAVRPKARLLERAGEVLGLRMLEPA